MAFGLSVRNASGVEIISESYRNYQVVAKGTFASGGAPAGRQVGQVVLMRPYNAVAGSTLRLMNENDGSGWESSTGTVEYMLIQQAAPASSESFGLRVTDADGQVCFEASRSQASPSAVVRQAVSTTPTAATVTVPAISVAGRKRWIAYPSPPDLGWKFARTGLNYWLNALITFNSDTSITLDATWTAGEYNPNGFGTNGSQIYSNWHMAAIFEA